MLLIHGESLRDSLINDADAATIAAVWTDLEQLRLNGQLPNAAVPLLERLYTLIPSCSDTECEDCA